ncbi:hypothetical protein [Streptomyces sp. NPDC018045]|uniref:hypothetical protein n=1 Tax=Streptomyces sp. NPDC018045 TaxID=3365037 RepID=UPI0037958AB5
MAIRHLVRLQFEKGGPVVEGEWSASRTASTRYTEWDGLYGSDLRVVVQLIEGAGGREHVHKTWTEGREVQGPAG